MSYNHTLNTWKRALVFDIETTGLPEFEQNPTGRGRSYYDPQQYSKYPYVVSVAWAVLDRKVGVLHSEEHIVLPTDYVIPEASTAIHGVTHAEALERGVPQDIVWRRLLDSTKVFKTDTLVAHNIDFDYKTVCASMYRNCADSSDSSDGTYKEVLNKLESYPQICTMKDSMPLLKLTRWPKLIVLCEKLDVIFTEEEAHNALADTLACAQCLLKISTPKCGGM